MHGGLEGGFQLRGFVERQQGIHIAFHLLPQPMPLLLATTHRAGESKAGGRGINGGTEKGLKAVFPCGRRGNDV